MTSKSSKKNNQQAAAVNSADDLDCGSTVSKFETEQEDEEYCFDENDEEQLDKMAAEHAELMALPEHLRPGWETLETNVQTDVSSLDKPANTERQKVEKHNEVLLPGVSSIHQKNEGRSTSVDNRREQRSTKKSTQENDDPTNNSSVDDTDEDDSENTEQTSDNKSQGGSKRKQADLTPATAGKAGTPAVLKKASRGSSNASVASSTSINIVRNKNLPSSAAPKQRIVPLLSDTFNTGLLKDFETKPGASSTKDQIRSATQSSGLASANDEQPIQKLKSLVDERTDGHWQHKKIRKILYNDAQEDRALTERDGKPAFLTAAEVHDGKLGCKLHEKHHAVYVLTIAVPEKIYEKMLLDETLKDLKFLQRGAVIHLGGIVNIKGKIGESTTFPHRRSTYYSCENRTDSISKVVNFLTDQKDTQIEEMVKITPLMSHSDLCSVPALIQMETLCSMLLGREGNFGYNFVGRATNASKEEMRENGHRLNNYMSQKIEVNGTKVTRRQLAHQKGVETRKKEFQIDGRTTNINIEAGLKQSKTLTEKFEKGGVMTSIAEQIAEKSAATKAKEFQNPDGTWTSIDREAAKKIANIKTTTMITLDSGQQVNQHQYDARQPHLEDRTGYEAPTMVHTTIHYYQYGWEGVCEQCDQIWCVFVADDGKKISTPVCTHLNGNGKHKTKSSRVTTPHAPPSPTSTSSSTPPPITPSTSQSAKKQIPPPSLRFSLVIYNINCHQEYHQTTVNLSNDSDSDEVTQR
ncbi:unnamed protein product [Adineta steineri]|uniref:Uncharacterized protein n=1 Tax=Adineta steineri TaxID=433720 RepID=A0A819NE83_9BILA|nr:unnamed protein product [Adineta steineri]CAF3994514.1 unnamed protein product [Adineta steineri]